MLYSVAMDKLHGGGIAMRDLGRVFWLGLGLALGIAATIWLRTAPTPVWPGNDPHEDYIMGTRPIALGAIPISDGSWLLDYRSKKLPGTIVCNNRGKIVGGAEVPFAKGVQIPR